MSYRNFIVYTLVIIITASIWEIAGNNFPAVRILISTPTSVLSYIQTNYSEILLALLTTFYESFIGLSIAVVFSFLVMIICLYFPKFLEVILPAMVTSQIIPLITLAPLFITLLGAGITSKVAMSALMCFFPIFINFATGIKTISKDILDLMRVYNASTSFKIFKVYFPLSLPSIFSGLKISATLAVIGAIVAEFNGADIGLGKNLFLAAKRLEPELMMSSLFFASILGAIMFSSVHLIELRIGKWYLKK